MEPTYLCSQSIRPFPYSLGCLLPTLQEDLKYLSLLTTYYRASHTPTSMPVPWGSDWGSPNMLTAQAWLWEP